MKFPKVVISRDLLTLEVSLFTAGVLVVRDQSPEDLGHLLSAVPTTSIVAVSDCYERGEDYALHAISLHPQVVLLYSEDTVGVDVARAAATIKMDLPDWSPRGLQEMLLDPMLPLDPSNSPDHYELICQLQECRLPRRRDLILIAAKAAARD